MSRPKSPVLRELLAQAPPPATRRRRARAAAPRKRCSLSLPADLLADLDAICAAQGAPRRDVVEHLLRTYVAQHAGLI